MDIISLVFNLIFTLIGAILSIYLAKLLKQNGKVLNKMDEGFRMIAKLIAAEGERTRQKIEDLS